MYDERTAVHEAGHATAAYALGRRVKFITVVPGDQWGGMCRFWTQPVNDARPGDTAAPLVTWAAAWQRRLAGDVVLALAGDLAEELFARPDTGTARLPESGTARVSDHLAELAEGRPPATIEELAEAARCVDEAGESDAGHVAEIAFEAHRGDLHRAASWTAWLAEESRSLLLLHEPTVRRLAALLQVHGTVGEQAAAACLRGEAADNG